MLIHAGNHFTDPALWTHWLSEPGSAISIAVASVVYARGAAAAWRHAGSGRGVKRAQAAFFAAGIGVLLIALVSPIDAMAEDLFWAHMLQHVLLAVVAPPLLVAGVPGTAALWAFPRPSRRKIVRFVQGNRALTAFWHFITLPAIAVVLHAVAIWTWHAPGAYILALRNPAAHALEHLSFLATGSLLWWAILFPRRSRSSGYAFGIVLLFVTMMQTGALGALIALSGRVWYPLQAVGAAEWGFTPLQDQQVAGLIMWVLGGVIYIIEMSVVFIVWMEHAQRRRVPAIATAVAAATLAAGCARSEASVVAGGSVDRGKQTITAMGCGSCHTISGIRGADGKVGPPLTGIANRSMIAGELANTPDNMVRWIMDPPGIEPGTAMPNFQLSAASARDIAAYLYTLH
jgi:cytochrome c oxidase assembly factor CtaG